MMFPESDKNRLRHFEKLNFRIWKFEKITIVMRKYTFLRIEPKSIMKMMKILKVAYENAPPYVRFLPKWGYVRQNRIKIHRRSVRKVIFTWRLRSWTFFPWRSHHGPTRGWYGNVSDIQNSIYCFSKVYFISKYFWNFIFSKWGYNVAHKRNKLMRHPYGTYVAFPLPLKAPPRRDKGRVRGT